MHLCELKVIPFTLDLLSIFLIKITYFLKNLEPFLLEFPDLFSLMYRWRVNKLNINKHTRAPD